MVLPSSPGHEFSGTGESGTGLSNWNDTIVATTAMLAGGNASDISTATTISSSVVEYNRRLHKNETHYLKLAKEGKSPEEQARLEAAALRAVGGEKGLEPIDPQRAYITSLVNKAEDYIEERELLKKIARDHGDFDAFEYGKLDAVKDFIASYNTPITQATNIIVTGIGVQSMKGLVPLISASNPVIAGGAGILFTITGWYTSGNLEKVIMPNDPIEGQRVLQSLSEKKPSYIKEKGTELAVDVVAAGVMRSIKGIASNAGKIYDKTKGFFKSGNNVKPALPTVNTTTSTSTIIPKAIDKSVADPSKKTIISNIKTVEERVQKIHKNSHKYEGETHVYRIIDKEGKTYKIGESTQGLTKYGESKRAKQQARKLERETGERYETQIRKTFDNKKDAYEYENQLIKRFRKLYDKDSLPGNKSNH